MKKQRASIDDVKKAVETYKGCRISLEAHKSKKKLYHKEGVIENVYPSIFTVIIDEPNSKRPVRLSFSYTDILTNTVKMFLLDQETNEDVFDF